MKCKKLVFVSFGDPYKLYELPFLKAYVNSYASSSAAVAATVAASLGDDPFVGKTPISLD